MRRRRTCVAGAVRCNLISLWRRDCFSVVADTSWSKTHRSERQPIRMAVALLSDSEEGETQGEASTVDLSRHGCRVEGDARLSHGQLIHVMPSNCAMMGRVVWVGQEAPDLAGEAGIEFLQPQPLTV